MKAHKLQLEESNQDWVIESLRAVALFQDLKDEAQVLKELAQAMTSREYHTGEKIIKEGEAGSELYVLVDGRASVFKNTPEGEPYKVVILDGTFHAFFGEGALLDSDARTATIQAESHCRCLVLDRKDFEKWSDSHPAWALPVLRRIAKVVLGRLKKSNGDLSLLYQALISEIRGH